MSSPENYNDLEKMGELQAKLQEISKNSLKQKKTGNKQAWIWKNSWLDQIRLLKRTTVSEALFLLDETFQLRFFRNFRTEDPTSEFFASKKDLSRLLEKSFLFSSCL